jgi:neutral ceramidase
MKHFILGLLIALPIPALAAEPMLVGFSTVDVTPPANYRMAGAYTEKIADGVADPILAKAMVVRGKFCLVICDVCGQERQLAEDVRASISKAIGIPKEFVCLSATHTHGGPMHYDPIFVPLFALAAKMKGIEDRHNLGNFPRKFREGCVRAAVEANKNAKPATFEHGVAITEKLNFNRRYLMKDGQVVMNPGKLNPNIARVAGPVDPNLPFVLARDANGKAFGSLASFAMHVTVYGGNKFSADYPAALQTELRKTHGPDFVSLFAEGCAGDMNQVNTMTKDPEPAPAVYGQKLAASLTAVKAKPVGDTVRAKAGEIRAKLRADRPDDVVISRERLIGEAAKKAGFLEQVEAYRVLLVNHMHQEFGAMRPLPIQVFALGEEVAIVTLPHEVFVEVGLEIRKRSPFPTTLMVTIANEVDCYVPTRKAFAEGSYEVTNSPYEPGIAEAMVEEAVRLLKEVAK